MVLFSTWSLLANGFLPPQNLIWISWQFHQGGTFLSASCPGCLPLPCHLGNQRFSLRSEYLFCCCVAANFDWGIPGYKKGMSLRIIIRPVTSEDIIVWRKYWWTKSPLHWLCGGDDTGISQPPCASLIWFMGLLLWTCTLRIISTKKVAVWIFKTNIILSWLTGSSATNKFHFGLVSWF